LSRLDTLACIINASKKCNEGKLVCRLRKKVGQKIATATMSDARIQATLSSKNSISGSLGGLQILDQTLIGKTHQRIISVGRDPLAEMFHESRHHHHRHHHHHHHHHYHHHQPEALRFLASRSCRQSWEMDGPEALVDISVRIGSVWYTHAPHLISELRSCADEFKQYLSNVARQIGAAATDMAIGLVNAEDWSMPQRKRLPSISVEAPANLFLKLDLVLDSPVIVIPRSSQSAQVFVAHLGTMSLQHEPPNSGSTSQKINLEVKDMNLYSLDISEKIEQVDHLPLPLPSLPLPLRSDARG
jgi:vacuolar protein sorting-associated protein 13D